MSAARLIGSYARISGAEKKTRDKILITKQRIKCIITNIVRGPDDFPDLLVLLNDPGDLEVTQLDLTVRKLTHQHNILRLKALNWIKI